MSKTWRPIPLHIQVLNTLKSMGPCDDGELLRSLKKEIELTPQLLSKILLQLEVRGLIHVSNATKGRRKVELRKT